MSVPELRIQTINDRDVNRDGGYVLYWMIAHRRSQWNFGLQRAAWWGAELERPVLVLEALRSGYRWASDRIHRFVIQGMRDNHHEFDDGPAYYYSYLEPEAGAGSGLLETLAEEACVVVTDDFPCFFLPRMVKAAGRQLDVKLEAVDSNGLLPMRAADKVHSRAHYFRRFLQKTLREHLVEPPMADPLHETDNLPEWNGNYTRKIKKALEKWPQIESSQFEADQDVLQSLPIDHNVKPASFDGGSVEAHATLQRFMNEGLDHYGDDRNHPDEDASSRLSPYLHFGHISAHEVFHTVMESEGWSPSDLAEKPNGSRNGWWGASETAEAFLDELITWRELGYNMCWQEPNYDRYSSLPDWARETLAEHADDKREYCYDLEQFENADTHDDVWNAAQNELVREGRMHNYLRMLWGKKILHWSESPQTALKIMIELNNKYAVDGRNPNSYSGIFWVLGRYDRAWGPEREIFGKIRYMTSDSTVKKLRMKKYLEKYS